MNKPTIDLHQIYVLYFSKQSLLVSFSTTNVDYKSSYMEI